MKKILLFTFLIFSATFTAFAQELSSSAEKRVALITRVMATELSLNEADYLRVRALNRERVRKADQIAERYAHDQEQQTRLLQELEMSYDQKLKAILNPAQRALYATYQQNPDAGIALSGAGSVGVPKE